MEEWDKSQSGNLVGNSLVGTCLTLPNLGFLWVFFKYPKISKNGNPLFFPVEQIEGCNNLLLNDKAKSEYFDKNLQGQRHMMMTCNTYYDGTISGVSNNQIVK